MAEFNPSEAVLRSSTGQLAKIMNLDEGTPDAWSEEDLAAMLRHQLAAPLEFDLSSVEVEDAEARKRDETLTGAAKKRIKLFGDLLFHREPPLELLRLAKEFFQEKIEGVQAGIAGIQCRVSVLPAERSGRRVERPRDLRPGAGRTAQGDRMGLAAALGGRQDQVLCCPQPPCAYKPG